MGIAQQTTIPVEFALEQNYPNPFNPSTVISWQLAVGSEVELKVFNLLGQDVHTLVNERQQAGFHSVEWDASDLASGVYLYRLQAGDFVETRKMLLIR
jgi:glucuronoarabinoxylan endo-1,4-beta-xylanase